MNKIEEIKKIKKMLEDGLLTESEYFLLKSEIINATTHVQNIENSLIKNTEPQSKDNTSKKETSTNLDLPIIKPLYSKKGIILFTVIIAGLILFYQLYNVGLINFKHQSETNDDSISGSKQIESILTKQENLLTIDEWYKIADYRAKEFYECTKNLANDLESMVTYENCSRQYRNAWVTFQLGIDDKANLTDGQKEKVKMYWKNTEDGMLEKVTKLMDENEKKVRPTSDNIDFSNETQTLNNEYESTDNTEKVNDLSSNINSADELEVADKKLNAIYKQVMAVLNETEKTELRHKQRKWIKYRDISCEEETKDMNGSLYNAFLNNCQKEKTEKRIEELRDILQSKE